MALGTKHPDRIVFHNRCAWASFKGLKAHSLTPIKDRCLLSRATDLEFLLPKNQCGRIDFAMSALNLSKARLWAATSESNPEPETASLITARPV